MSARKILVTLIAVAVMAVPGVASAASIRVTSHGAPQLGNLEWNAGSARSYVDTRGDAHRLQRRTALGQLVAATAFSGTPLRIFQYSFGPYVTRIGVRAAKPTAGWMVFVNGRPAQVGAADVILKRDDRVLWMYDPNIAKKGPYALDVQTELGTNGLVRATVHKIGGPKPVPAAGASIIIDGVRVGVTDAGGVYTYAPGVDPATGLPADWDVLQARMKGTIPSQFVIE